MDGAVPTTVNWILVAYGVAFCAFLSTVVGGFQLWRGATLLPAFVVLLAPWLLVFLDTRIVPVYVSFAFDPEAWGNPVLPVWVSPMVGLLLVLAAVIRAVSRVAIRRKTNGSQ
jgi:hypothetical protein